MRSRSRPSFCPWKGINKTPEPFAVPINVPAGTPLKRPPRQFARPPVICSSYFACGFRPLISKLVLPTLGRAFRDLRELLSNGGRDSGNALLCPGRDWNLAVRRRRCVPHGTVDESGLESGCGRRRDCPKTLRQSVCLGNDADHHWHVVSPAHAAKCYSADQGVASGGIGGAWCLHGV